MFTISNIYNFVRFLKDYKIDFLVNPYTKEVEFFDNENRTTSIPIEIFDSRPMWKNIERIRVWLDEED